SGSANLTVNAPPAGLAITSLSPNPMSRSGAPQNLTINGSGFQAGPDLQVVMTAPAGVEATPSVISVAATQVQVSVVVGFAARTWTVQVINPDGSVSNIASLTVQ